jgi:8-oxo-dGTP pyrophosphatase MutT (NUDIX family)
VSPVRHGRARLLALDDPQLAFDPDPVRALAYLQALLPSSPEQGHVRAEIVRFVLETPRPLERANLEGHLTASALVLDHAGERALLTRHRKLGRWLQLGGHCDGDANLAGVALREAIEESGIAGLAVDPRPIDVDVHPIPARGDVPEHLHLDTRFVVHAPEGARETCSEESLELGWFTPEEASTLELDASLRRLFAAVFGE